MHLLHPPRASVARHLCRAGTPTTYEVIDGRKNIKGETMSDTTNGQSSGRIYWIGGSKGGVGKSMMTVAMVDYLLERGEKVLLVECDTSNPDTWKAHKELVTTECINLDEGDGWIHLVNTCDAHRDSVVVVNTAARNNLAVKQFGRTLDSSLEELDMRLVVFWMINRQRDGLQLLHEFMEAICNGEVHVVRNGYFGEEKKFELYNTSKLRAEVEGRGGKSMTLPDLADRVADDLYTKRLSVRDASKTLPIGNRAELRRWRDEVAKVLSEVTL
jgi:hypothetical protein